MDGGVYRGVELATFFRGTLFGSKKCTPLIGELETAVFPVRQEAQDRGSPTVVGEMALVDSKELAKGGRVFDALLRCGDQLPDVLKAVSLRYIDGAM